jgi:hypothetical protein
MASYGTHDLALVTVCEQLISYIRRVLGFAIISPN